MGRKIPIEVSARHIHISQKDLEKLFGSGYKLKRLKELNQPLDFASKEELVIKNNSKELTVRIIGPVRKNTQVEISLTDAFYLGIKPPVRKSGNIIFTPGIALINKKKKKKLKIKRGVIIAQRHIHCKPEEAKLLKLKKYVSIKVGGDRGLIFNKVKVRTSKDYRLFMHIDTDEANAAGINKKTKGHLI